MPRVIVWVAAILIASNTALIWATFEGGMATEPPSSRSASHDPSAIEDLRRDIVQAIRRLREESRSAKPTRTEAPSSRSSGPPKVVNESKKLDECLALLKRVVEMIETKEAANLRLASQRMPKRNESGIIKVANRYMSGDHEALLSEHRFLTNWQVVELYGPPLRIDKKQNGMVDYNYLDHNRGSCTFRFVHGYVIAVFGKLR